ncbi:MAG TPA: RNA 2',3'-cyclic phosphodiesterase [Phycisphaerales bacterium]|nr:RNA 2',3'-cyclic phosphodiesterase [Phycisphaerales bacterium]
MSGGDARVRLFVALYPPAETVRLLRRAVNRLALGAGRDTPAEQVHLTLLFIGDRTPHELAGVAESVERSCAGFEAFPLTPRRLITLPERGLPRLIAAETDAPTPLVEIQRRLARRLARSQRDADRFRPHLTLVRFRPGDRSGRVDEPVECEPFVVDRIALMRSVLTHTGAEHREVAAAALEPRR